MMRSIVVRIGLAWLGFLTASGQSVSNPADTVFGPGLDTGSDTPVPLRPAEALTRRPRGVRPPSLELRNGDRVLFLGDRLLEREVQFGFLETRMTCQSPELAITFRNLSGATNHPLADAAAGPAGAAGDWLPRLLGQVASVRPTVVIVGFGTAAAAGEAGVPAFSANYARLLEGLRRQGKDEGVRIAVLTPTPVETARGAKDETGRHDAPARRYAEAVAELATARAWPLVNAFDALEADAATAEARGKTSAPLPRLTANGTDLTAYGYWRLTLPLERGLGWVANNWRFGLMPGNTIRDGGFGGRLTQYSRGTTWVQLDFHETRLPSPNPEGYIELLPGSRPLCYIQVTGLDSGQYELTVDSRAVCSGSAEDWGRFMVVGQGPSWDQAEQLRQTIVAKNALVRERWLPLARAADAPPPGWDASPSISELEAKIHQLRQPVRRAFKLSRPARPPGARPSASIPPSPPPPPVPGREQ